MSPHEISRRKAAVLIASLDADTADMLLSGMPPEEAEAVRRESLTLDTIDPDEQAAVIVEFVRSGLPSPPVQNDPPGLELNDALAVELQIRTETEEGELSVNEMHATGGEVSHDADAPFQFLYDAEPGALVALLEHEHPQVIALVLAHLPPHRASLVLSQLPASTQTEAVRRLMELERTDPAVVREVEQSVAAWLRQRQPMQRQTPGLATVSAILNAADSAARRQILGNLSVHDRRLAQRFSASPVARKFSFGELCETELSALAHALGETNLDDAALALAGTSTAVAERVLQSMAPDDAKSIRAAMSHLGPARLVDIQRAQSAVAQLASQFIGEGEAWHKDVEHLTAVA
jgi:flagellar motor switch protein FliG